MKFLEAYNLICEDRADDILAAVLRHEKFNGIRDILNKDNIKGEINAFINKLPADIKSHNKMNKFLSWFFTDQNNWSIFDNYFYRSEWLFRNYLKYNIDLSKYSNVKDLIEYLKELEDKKNLVIDSNLAKKIYEDKEKIVIIPRNLKGAIKYGSKTWCISQPYNTHWISYLSNGKLSHFVIYKCAEKVEIPGFAYRNWNITNVQVDLYGNFYITNTENTVGLGVTDTKADKILQFMKLDKKIFKSLNDKETLKLIADNNKDFSYYARAASTGNIKVIKQFLDDKNKDPNMLDANNNTILMFAANEMPDNINIEDINKIIALLLNDTRVNINAQNNGRWTAFSIVCSRNNYDAIELFLKDPRTDITSKNNNGKTGYALGDSTTKKLIKKYRAGPYE